MTTTDDIVKAVLEEEKQEWKARRRQEAEGGEDDLSDDDEGAGDRGGLLGKRARDWEEEAAQEEGAPVKVNDVKGIRERRAEMRREKEAGMAHREEGEGAEEELGEDARAQEQEQGIKIIAFKAEDDEAEGEYNEDGVWVQKVKRRRGAEDEEEDGDEGGDVGDEEWWKSEGQGKVDDRTLEAHERVVAAVRGMESGPAAMSLAQETGIKRRVAGYLLAGETVAAGLRRIGREVEEQRRAKRGGGARADESEAERKKREFEERAKKMQFEALTDLADQLMSAGETDIYSETKESIEAALRVAGGAGGGAGPSAFATAAADDDMDDMFGDDDSARPKPKPAAAAVAAAAARPAVAPRPAGPQQTRDDFKDWPLKELRRFIEERGDDIRKYTDKDQLLERVVELANSGPAGASDADAAAAAAVLPAGYALDPGTGYYWNGVEQLYYDTKTRMFGVPATGQWFGAGDPEILRRRG